MYTASLHSAFAVYSNAIFYCNCIFAVAFYQNTLKLPTFYLFWTKISSQNALNAILILALNFKKFPGGGGEQTKSATVRFFPGSAPARCVEKLLLHQFRLCFSQKAVFVFFLLLYCNFIKSSSCL